MTNLQLYLAMLAPMVGNILALTIGFTLMNARFSDLREDVLRHLTLLRDEMGHRFTEVDRRFTDLEKMWRAELRRVEDILDARLKALEERFR